MTSPRTLYFLGPPLALAILAFDITTALGIAAGVPYLLLVLLTLPRGCGHHTIPAAATGIVLTLVGWELSPAGGDVIQVTMNRLLAVFAIAVVGAAVVLKHRADRHLQEEVEANLALVTRMRDQEALAKLGELASTVAHEVKNPMAGIVGAVHILGKRLPEDAPEQEVLERITRRITELVAWVDDLLQYARPAEPHPAAINGAELVRDTVALFRADESMAAVRVDLDLDPTAQLRVDPTLVSRALLNLLINAGQAMRGVGAIHVGLRNGGAWAEIDVTDTGPGIPEELRDRIFEPFFTTRGGGVGTGLGLPAVRRTVEAHGGAITLDCPDAGGTAIRMRLPGVH